jgi:hypothetical protein
MPPIHCLREADVLVWPPALLRTENGIGDEAVGALFALPDAFLLSSVITSAS